MRRRVVGHVGVVSGRGDGSEEVDAGVSSLDRWIKGLFFWPIRQLFFFVNERSDGLEVNRDIALATL